MKINPASTEPPRLHVTEDLVSFLSASIAAGNTGARVAIKKVHCPACANVSLSASATLKSANVPGHVMRRQFDVVAHCKAPPCTYKGNTDGKFNVG